MSGSRLLPVPEPGPGVSYNWRVATVGICGTDAGEFVHGPRFHPVDTAHPHSGHFGPTIPGHEFSGWVSGVGEGVTGFTEGDLVAVGAGVSCGHCPPCQRGYTNLCQEYWTVGLHSNGGLAESAVVPASCTFNLSNSAITPDLAAMTQPMSIALHATRRGRVAEGDLVTVLGAGGIGSFIVHAAADAGATVTAVDLDPARLDTAARLGAASTLDVSAPGPDQLLNDDMASVVFECTGRPDSLLRALQLVADGGRVVVVGHQPEPVAVDFREVALDELEIIGTQAHVFAQDFPAGGRSDRSRPGRVGRGGTGGLPPGSSPRSRADPDGQRGVTPDQGLVRPEFRCSAATANRGLDPPSAQVPTANGAPRWRNMTTTGTTSRKSPIREMAR